MYGSYNWVEGWLYEIKIEKTHSRERSMVVVKEKSKAKKLFTFVGRFDRLVWRVIVSQTGGGFVGKWPGRIRHLKALAIYLHTRREDTPCPNQFE